MKHKTRTKALSWLLSLAMLFSVMPGMSLTAYAYTETLLTTITATAKEQANYSTANVATVSFSYTAEGSSAYTAIWGWWGYGWTATVNAAEGYTITKCVFYDDQDRTAEDSEAPFVVETTAEDKTPRVNGTPILANQSKGITKIEVYGYAAPATDHTSTYTLTIPSALNVSGSGWNATSGISATGSLADGKKLTVTATSANSWALKSGDNSVGYNLATATGTYSSSATPASWEFTELSNTVATKPMGIIVEDYSSKPAGTYQDTVTFTAKVENAGIPVSSVAINNAPTEDLFVNSTGTLTAIVLPNDATDKTVTWSSSDPDYVSINAETGEYTIMGKKGYGSATITATAGDKTAICTITGKVTYTSLSAGDVIHVGDTVYANSPVYVKYGSTNSSINKNLGVYTLINDSGTYKWTTSNGNSVNTRINTTSNSDGLYVSSGSGTSSDRFTFAVHTTN